MSQIATTVEQSQLLLRIGLKSDSADMLYRETYYNSQGEQVYQLRILSDVPRCFLYDDDSIPAWSFHRLLEILDEDFRIDQENIDEAFLRIITRIKVAINDGMINSKYLIDEVPDTSDKALCEL